jgi:hypothetical protein
MEGHSYDCADFWLWRTCPHLFATSHVLKARDGVDIVTDTLPAFPANKKRSHISGKRRALAEKPS